MWAEADSGTKAVDLGAGLAATGTFGAILVFLERELSERIDRAKVEIQATAPVASPDPDSQEVASPTVKPAGPSRQYSAEFAGWIRDNNRIDASQVRLRVRRDGEYYQFFTGVVSGPALRVAVHGSENLTLDQFKRGCVSATLNAIQQVLSDGFEPLDDPTKAVEILIDSALAERLAHAQPNERLKEGTEVLEWLG
jgi:hypothetical protein